MMIQWWWSWTIALLLRGRTDLIVVPRFRIMTPHERRIYAIKSMVNRTGSIFGDLDN